jgi:hypothetical protein
VSKILDFNQMKKIFLLVVFITFIVLNINSQVPSHLPEIVIRSVVLLEKKVDSLFVPHGTGFLILSYDKDKPVIVVTNEHILRNKYIYITVPADSGLIKYMNIKNYGSIEVNGEEWEFTGNALRLKYELIQDSTFVSDKELDIAAFKIKMANSIFVNDSTELKLSKISCLGRTAIKYKKDIPLGTETFFIGFPFAIGTSLGWCYNGNATKLFSANIPSPLIRRGIVAWKSAEYDTFLLDAFSYNGNSGSPIFATLSDFPNQTCLIGIVAGHLPSENSDNVGLARCIWSDKIIELIKKLK